MIEAIPYQIIQAQMLEHVDGIIAGTKTEAIWLVEHESIYTYGVSTDVSSLDKELNIVQASRGGKITYHGPGQRIIYPILNLNRDAKDIRLYIHRLQQWIINSLAHFKIDAFAIENMIGIWVKQGQINAKIASIGVKLKKWVTYHGIAVNISTDLSEFAKIRPCGIDNLVTTSLLDLGIDISLPEFDQVLKAEFSKIFK